MINIANYYFIPFHFIWYNITIVIAVLGIAVIYFERHLPHSLVNAYKFGKLSQSSSKQDELDRTVQSPLDLWRCIHLRRMPLVQKRRFVDFYAFAIILNVALITLVHLNCSTGKCERLHYWFNLLFGNDATSSVSQTTATLVFSMALLHYVRRWYETVFISIFSDGRMNILHYLSGFAFYGSSAFLFTDMLLPKRETLFHHSKTEHSHLLIGFLVYAIGSLIQFVTSVQLSRMRRKVRADGTEEIIMRHTIPTGGLFEYISSPHYLAEMIIYTGLFIGCNLHKSMLPLTMFVVVNQTMAALMCHQWYQRTFGQSYPRERKAIIPFIL